MHSKLLTTDVEYKLLYYVYVYASKCHVRWKEYLLSVSNEVKQNTLMFLLLFIYLLLYVYSNVDKFDVA